MADERKRKKLYLDKKIPVFIHYTMVSANEENEIVFYEDIYNRASIKK